MPAKKIKIVSEGVTLAEIPAIRPVEKAVEKPNAKANEKPTDKTAKKSRRPCMACVAWVLIVIATMALSWALLNSGILKPRATRSTMPTEEPIKAPEVDASADYREMGKQKLLEGDVVGALDHFVAAIEANPANALNYIYRGEVLMSGSNFEAAILDFDAALGIEPSVIAYYDRAMANIKLENLAAAKSDLDRAVDAQYVYPESQAISTREIYSKRAQINLWLRNWADAERDYTSAIAENVGDLDWNDYTGRAEARTNRGDFENAVADYISAITIISERIQKTPESQTRENMSRQAMGFYEKSGALRVKLGQMELAVQDLQAAYTLALALDDMENRNRLQILITSIQ